MSNQYDSPRIISTPAVDRRTSLARGLAWAIPLGICGFFVPFALLGVELVIRIAFADVMALDLTAKLERLAVDGAASAVVCSLIFASSALANFSPSRGIGFVRSLLVMALYGIAALIAAMVLSIVFFPERGNPKSVRKK